jgi:hypothetical protein
MDIIPRGQEAFNTFVKRFLTTFLEKRDGYGYGENTNDGKWAMEKVIKTYGTYSTAYAPWSNPSTRTKVNSAQLQEAREEFEPLLRQLIQMLKVSPMVSKSDLVDMGLTPRHEGAGTLSPVATDSPPYRVETPRPFQVILHFDHKPHGQHGVEILWLLLEKPANVLIKDLVHSSFDTRTPYHFDLDDSHRGQHLYFALRWENTRGEKGPWTPVDTVVVP